MRSPSSRRSTSMQGIKMRSPCVDTRQPFMHDAETAYPSHTKTFSALIHCTVRETVRIWLTHRDHDALRQCPRFPVHRTRPRQRPRLGGATVALWHGHALARPRVFPWQRLGAWPILPEEDQGQIVSGPAATVCPRAGGGVACHAAALPPGMPPRRSGDGRSRQSAASAPDYSCSHG